MKLPKMTLRHWAAFSATILLIVLSLAALVGIGYSVGFTLSYYLFDLQNFLPVIACTSMAVGYWSFKMSQVLKDVRKHWDKIP